MLTKLIIFADKCGMCDLQLDWGFVTGGPPTLPTSLPRTVVLTFLAILL
jgi:hypothetical protein